MEAHIENTLWIRLNIFQFGPLRGGRLIVDSFPVCSNPLEAFSLLSLRAPEAGLSIRIDDGTVTGCF